VQVAQAAHHANKPFELSIREMTTSQFRGVVLIF
jgi:hypothetical protein